MKKTIWMISLAALAMIGAAGQAVAQGEVAAVVGDQTISKQQLVDTLLMTYGRRTLQQLITANLVEQEAKKAGVTITEREVNEVIAARKKEFGDKFQDWLRSENLTEASLPAQARTELLARKLRGDEVMKGITEEEIKQYYDQVREGRFHLPAMIRFQQIIAPTEAIAKTVIQELQAGRPFEALAKNEKYNQSGKLVAVLPRSEPGKEEDWEKALFALELDAYNKTPIKVKDRYLVAKITDKSAERNKSLADVHDELKEEMFVRRFYDEAYPQWISQLRQQYKIEPKLELPS